MSKPDILEFKDENGNALEYWTKCAKTITVTVVNAAGVAQDISSWISGSNHVHYKAKTELDTSTFIWEKDSDSNGVAFLTDGTDGKFTAAVDATDTATAYDSIIVMFFRHDGSSYSQPFEGGIWSSRIRQSLLN
jgi:hypothetical protein